MGKKAGKKESWKKSVGKKYKMRGKKGKNKTEKTSSLQARAMTEIRLKILLTKNSIRYLCDYWPVMIKNDQK